MSEHPPECCCPECLPRSDHEQALVQTVLEAAIAWRDVIGGKLTIPPWAYIDVENHLADAVDALMARREAKGG